MTIDTSDFPPFGVSGPQSVESSAMVSRMTPTPPPALAGTYAPPALASVPTDGGVGLAELTWFLAICFRCGGEDFSEPFSIAVERDDWAARHVEATGHTVMLATDGGVLAMMLQRAEDTLDQFRFLCTGTGVRCQRWNGPYDTPQLALASGRDHVCAVA